MNKLLWGAACVAAMIAAVPASAGSVIVGPGTDVSSLDADAVKRIFLGRESQVGGKPVVVVFQKGGSVREAFDNAVLGKPGAQLSAYWSKLVFTGKAKAPDEVDGDAAVKAKVAATAGAIGYVADSAVDGSVRKVFDF
jgi:ABC-type phosphate transport system substrate-binding protein